MKKKIELIMYEILCGRVAIFCWQELTSLFQEQKKLNACSSSKLSFSKLAVALQMRAT